MPQRSSRPEGAAVRPLSLTQLLWRLVRVALLVQVGLAVWSGYRAVRQVFSLDVTTDTPVLTAGTVISAHTISSGRAPVTLTMQVVQDTVVETIALHRISANALVVYDPRVIRDSVRVTVPRAPVSRLRPGAAMVRVTALGTRQFGRTPPATIRTLPVTIGPP